MEEELWTLDVYEVRIQQSLTTTTTGRVLVSKVKLNKSVGPDGISRKILRELAKYLGAPITAIINSSLHLGRPIVPDQWKLSRITTVLQSILNLM